MDFLNVHQVLDNLTLKDDMMVCEFGCGGADFSVALAKRVSRGRVYALDIQEEKLSAVKNKLKLQKINNVSLILCDLELPEGSTLQNNSLDIVVIPNVLFQAENKNAIIKEAKRILKSGGQLLIIDWLKIAPLGPKEGLVNPDTLKKMANTLGLSLTKEFAIGDYYYGLLFVK